jgi:hypothetical protein
MNKNIKTINLTPIPTTSQTRNIIIKLYNLFLPSKTPINTPNWMKNKNTHKNLTQP